jgi:RND family efflux transporter MFP subunit
MLAQRNNGRALVKVAIVLVVLIAAAVWASHSLRSTARVKIVNRDTAVDAVTGSVTVTADGGYKEIKSEAAGKVIEAQAINKDTPFQKNAPLVQLDTSDLDRRKAEVQRNFDSMQEKWKIELANNPEEDVAKDALATAKRLFDLKRASEEQVKSAQRALDAVQKRLKLAEFERNKAEADYKVAMDNFKVELEKMTIPAPPMDGVVQAPLTFEGALIGATQSVAIVYSNARIVSAKISEESIGKIKVGQKARLRLLSYGSRPFDATVSKMLPTADETQRFEVWLKVDVEDPAILRPGSTGEVTITVAERPNQVVIPRRALFSGDKVWVVKNGRVERRQVKIGFDSALNVVEILEGLDAGEQIIVDRLDEFHEGERVQVHVVN